MSETRLDSPRIYDWQITENSTRYEFQRSQPRDENVLRIQFSILATINAVVALTTFALVLTILKNRKIRANPFNLYLLFIAIPDFVASASCVLTCAMSAPEGRFYSEAMCGWQAFYLCFAFTANAWMNSVIVHQIHKLLKYSHQRRRYFPPTLKVVMQQAGAVYAWSLLLASIVAFPIPGVPVRTHLYNGLACFAMEYDSVSTYVFYFGVVPLCLGLPILYSAVVLIDIRRNKLLPPTGKRRKISVFLLRIIAFYYIIWFPFICLSIFGNFVRVNTWVFWIGAAASHLQGVVTVFVVGFTNKEIKEKMLELLCCGHHQGEEHQTSLRPTSLSDGSIVPRTFVSKILVSSSKKSASSSSRREAAAADLNRGESTTMHISTYDHSVTECNYTEEDRIIINLGQQGNNNGAIDMEGDQERSPNCERSDLTKAAPSSEQEDQENQFLSDDDDGDAKDLLLTEKGEATENIETHRIPGANDEEADDRRLV